MKLRPFFEILRVSNLLLLAAGVIMGFWLAHSPLGYGSLLLLVIASMCCAGFGNVINDVADINTDAISHPDRPLTSGEMRPRHAIIFAALLAVIALGCAFAVSIVHGAGVCIPIAMLVLYALHFKGTPLIGNILVSVLVAYGIIFGGLTAGGIPRLFIPACLAFLLNLPREIIKDIQDIPGDSAAGIRTSAVLPVMTLKAIITGCAVAYVMLVFLPFILHQFGTLYAVLCLATVVPLHVYWFSIFYKSDWTKTAARISLLIKYEMFCGLLALALDQIFKIHGA